MTKQLKALYETKEMLERKWKEGKKYHKWNTKTCPLCKTFKCNTCPFLIEIDKRELNCVGFFEYFTRKIYFGRSRIDETLSIIISMIQYYEEV